MTRAQHVKHIVKLQVALTFDWNDHLRRYFLVNLAPSHPSASLTYVCLRNKPQSSDLPASHNATTSLSQPYSRPPQTALLNLPTALQPSQHPHWLQSPTTTIKRRKHCQLLSEEDGEYGRIAGNVPGIRNLVRSVYFSLMLTWPGIRVKKDGNPPPNKDRCLQGRIFEIVLLIVLCI